MDDAAEALEGPNENMSSDELALRLGAVDTRVYPELDKLPAEVMRSWRSKEWDWSREDGGWPSLS